MTSAFSDPLPRMLELFQRAHPRVDVRVEEVDTRVAVQSVHRRGARCRARPPARDATGPGAGHPAPGAVRARRPGVLGAGHRRAVGSGAGRGGLAWVWLPRQHLARLPRRGRGVLPGGRLRPRRPAPRPVDQQPARHGRASGRPGAREGWPVGRSAPTTHASGSSGSSTPPPSSCPPSGAPRPVRSSTGSCAAPGPRPPKTARHTPERAARRRRDDPSVSTSGFPLTGKPSRTAESVARMVNTTTTLVHAAHPAHRWGAGDECFGHRGSAPRAASPHPTDARHQGPRVSCRGGVMATDSSPGSARTRSAVPEGATADNEVLLDDRRDGHPMVPYKALWAVLLFGWVASYADRTLTGPVVAWMIENKAAFIGDSCKPGGTRWPGRLDVLPRLQAAPVPRWAAGRPLRAPRDDHRRCSGPG